MLRFTLPLFLCLTTIGLGYEVNSAGIEVWQAVEPYFLPEDHPIKPVLDGIFHSPEVTHNQKNLRKAGFEHTTPGRYTKTIVATHPKLKGYLVKMYTDVQVGIEDWSHWKHRVEGANLVRDAIAAHGYEHLMTVPRKWIYPLPSQFAPPPRTQRKQFVLIVEDMQLVSDKINEKKWKSPSLPKSTLDATYILLTELGLWDSVYIFNIPFTKDNKIAFIDTEFYHGWPVHLSRTKQYLSKGNRQYWEGLINNGGPVQ